jgi:heptosyltransferase-2/heptosyltransferase-3
MPAPPVQPIVIWFGRVGDLILLSALLEVLHRRFGSPCHVIGAGSWPAQIYAAHSDVARVSCLHRYTAWVFDPAWWRTLRALRAGRADPVYVCETDPRKLARIRRLLRFSGTEAARCVFLAPESSPGATHWVDAQTGLDTALPHASKIAPTHWIDRLVSFGRLTPAAFNAADYPWPAPPPRGAPLLTVSAAARAECAAWLERQGWGERTLILVQPGNRRTMRGRRLRVSAADDKAWPLERWAALLHRIHARLPQAVIVLCGAPRESLLLEWIAAAAQLPAVAAAELPLPRLLALCARAQHDLRRHRSCACRGSAGPAAGGAVRRALPAAVAAAQPDRLAGVRRRRTTAVQSPRSDFRGGGVRGLVCAWHGGGQRTQDDSSARHCSVTVLRRKRGSGPVRGRSPPRQARMRSR